MSGRGAPQFQTQEIGYDERSRSAGQNDTVEERFTAFKHEDLEQRRFSESFTPTTAEKKPILKTTHQKVNSKEGYQSKNRLSKACDSCSIRKVKCDEQGPPCKACRSLEIPCTFSRPSRRRGPPNKHAESIKKQKLDRPESNSEDVNTSSSSLPPLSSAQTLSAESICPLDLILLLVDDFFDLCHPIVPFPHEPSFRISLKDRKDTHDQSFLALIAGMIGYLVAWYPRRPHKRLLSLGLGGLFTRSIDFVTRCRQVLLQARGMNYLSSPTLNIYDAATSYFMMAMTCCTYQMRGADLSLGESYNILRYLEAYKPINCKKRDRNMIKPVDHIEEQMARRIYWTLFVAVRSASTFAQGASDGEELMGPETPTRPHPPLPEEVDDEFIERDVIHSSSKPHSRLTGFNKNVRILFILDRLIATELSYGIEQAYERQRQKKTIIECLNDLARVYAELPDSLAYRGDPARLDSCETEPATPRAQSSSRRTEFRPDKFTEIDDSPFDDTGPRHVTDCETHRANIHSSYLTVQSFLVEKYWTICDAALQPLNISSPSTSFSTESAKLSRESETEGVAFASAEGIRAERRRIAMAMLQILSSSRPVFLELNSFPLCMKIRQIASTVTDFSHGVPASSSTVPARPSSSYPRGDVSPQDRAVNVPENELTNEFLKILSGLEKGGSFGRVDSRRYSPTTWGSDTENEENELRTWADLSQNQMNYVTLDAPASEQKDQLT